MQTGKQSVVLAVTFWNSLPRGCGDKIVYLFWKTSMIFYKRIKPQETATAEVARTEPAES